MTIYMDHIVVATKDPVASAKSLAEVLGVEWQESDAVGRYSPVYLNEGMTVDFARREDFQTQHYCFRTDAEQFEAVQKRLDAAGIVYRSGGTMTSPVGVNYRNGGMNLWWTGVEGHLWEILTVSYARKDGPIGRPANWEQLEASRNG
jgi:hypothetical protein